MITLTVSTAASEWEYSADVFTGLMYTNNVSLVSAGEDDETILELTPQFTVSRDGKNVDVQLDYRLQGLLYAREDRRNEVYNYLQSTLQAVLIPGFMGLDADASISQTVIDPLIASGNSSISTSGNTAEQMTVNVSPYIERQLFNPTTIMRLSASGGLVEYDEPQLVDNTAIRYAASVVNEGGGGPFNWLASFNETTVDYDLGQEISLARVTGEIGLRLGPRTEIVASGGEDINDFGALSGTRVAEGSFWNVGFRGSVGNTVDYDVRFGEQFFGDSYSVRFTRSSRTTELAMSYQEEATTIGAQQLDYINAQDLLGLPSYQADINGFEVSQRDPELYIRRRGDLTTSLETGKSSFGFRVYYEDRSYIRTELDGAREQVMGSQFTWTWSYDSVTAVTTSSSYQQFRSRDGFSAPEDVRFSVQVRREIFTDGYVQASTWFNTRSASNVMREYDEIAVRVGFGRRF